MKQSPHYYIHQTTVYDEDNIPHLTYGITALDTKGNPLKTIPDISLEKHKIEALILKMNRGKLSLVHFLDVVEDFLADDLPGYSP